MNNRISDVIRAAGGSLAGKVRLQKTIYLLDQIGFESGFEYEYHHYGPYSEGLADQVEDDVAFGYIKAIPRRRKADGVPYVVYEIDNDIDGVVSKENDINYKFGGAIDEFSKRSSTILELSATIHWIFVKEQIRDWEPELRRRKTSKATPDRVAEALCVLDRLGLPPKRGV